MSTKFVVEKLEVEQTEVKDPVLVILNSNYIVGDPKLLTYNGQITLLQGELPKVKSDVYGWGCVLWECLQGQLPWHWLTEPTKATQLILKVRPPSSF